MHRFRDNSIKKSGSSNELEKRAAFYAKEQRQVPWKLQKDMDGLNKIEDRMETKTEFKICKDCGENKSASEYSVDKKHLRSYCKACGVIRTALWVKKNFNEVARKALTRYRLKDRVLRPNRTAAPNNLTRIRQWGKRLRSKLVRPASCQSCGHQTNHLNAIVENYETPLDISGWYCNSCMEKWYQSTNQKEKYAKYLDPNYVLPYKRVLDRFMHTKELIMQPNPLRENRRSRHK